MKINDCVVREVIYRQMTFFILPYLSMMQPEVAELNGTIG